MADSGKWLAYLRRLGVILVFTGLTLYEVLVVGLLWSELNASQLRATDRVLVLLGLLVLPLPLYLIGRFVGSSGRVNLRLPGDVEIAINQLEERQEALSEQVSEETRKLEERLYGKVSTAEQTLYPLLGGPDPNSAERLDGRHLVLSSKGFAANVVAAELLAQHLEQHAITVERRFKIGGTQTNYAYIMNGWSDLFVDYTGTGCVFLRVDFRGKTADEILRELDPLSRERFGFTWCRPIGTSTDYCLIAQAERARELGVETISDVASTSRGRLRYCGTFEFSARPDGLAALKEFYGLRFASETLCAYGEDFALLRDGEADVGVGLTNDPMVERHGLICLEDDRGFFPEYAETPVVRLEALERIDGLREALDAFSDLGLVNDDLEALIHDYQENPRALGTAARSLLQRKQRTTG